MEENNPNAVALGKLAHKKLLENSTEEQRLEWARKGALATKKSWKKKRRMGRIPNWTPPVK